MIYGCPEISSTYISPSTPCSLLQIRPAQQSICTQSAFTLRLDEYERHRDASYPATAVKSSARFAVVRMPTVMAKIMVNPPIMPNLKPWFLGDTKLRAEIAPNRSIVAIRTVMMETSFATLRSG